ncbi:hypothetical protein B9479_005184 [Cryptococcus floricola]|uniref:Major facilitator superfamily (MFS) profile domain-containing protein n=1 Tax=Cryptococcus floricola TaxID=2591691 RepID=A0A5D3AVH4_9TREE|nr:hypothetical protein B9479_005184 [Cryptococcus floricola]
MSPLEKPHTTLDSAEKDLEITHAEHPLHHDGPDHLHSPEDIRNDLSKGGVVQMRSKYADLGFVDSIKRFKLLGGVAMAAAFSASLDGYQINLNGGIVSNAGFIRQMASPGTTVIKGSYVSAWGGVQSAGQTLGQIFLQYATEALGRKMALYILWVFLVASIFAETFASHWWHWLLAKLFSGIGVGMLQATLPVYLSEISPTQVRGFFINAYSFWFCLGQLFASVALNELKAMDPYNYKIAIYSQWPMIAIMGVIFVLLPESPWWLASKGKLDQAAKMLERYQGHLEGFNVADEVAIMTATLEESKLIAQRTGQQGTWAVFKGSNLFRLFIASWPKMIQQFVGLTVFNTYATYFFQLAGNSNPFLVTVILSCIFFACLATFSTTGASAIGYAYAAEVPTQRLRAQTAGWGLALSNLIAIMFSFCTPLMLNGDAHWNVKTGFFFAGTGSVATVVGWFILPEVARRTPAELDEMFEKKVNPRKFKGYVTEVEMQSREVEGEGVRNEL